MNPTALDPFVESHVEAFESAILQSPGVQLESFLPTIDHEKYLAVAAELVRVDMDLAWHRGERRMLTDFLNRLPLLFQDPNLLEQLAFEEYRQRRRAGDPVDPSEYDSKFSIDTSGWDGWSDYDDGSVHQRNGSTEVQNHGSTAVEAKEPLAGATNGELAIGTRWSGFEIVRLLGKGSFGRTYLARQDVLAGREVVLKFSEFENREAHRLAKLQHTNITPVYSVHSSDRGTVICMPYVGSVTLADWLHESAQGKIPAKGHSLSDFLDSGPSSEQESEARRFYLKNSYARSVLWIVARLADGLQHAHERGILHRDVKPANILLREDGEPLLIDFNLSTEYESHNRDSVGGTIPYMAPEVLQSYLRPSVVNHPHGVGCDVYALGVCLFQLLTGKTPFASSRSKGSKSVNPQMVQDRQARSPRLSHNCSEASPGVQSIVDKCLEFDPQTRYQSAADLRDDILHHLANRPLAVAPNTSVVERVSKWVRRHPAWFSYSTALIALTVSLVVMMVAWSVRETQVTTQKARLALVGFRTALEELQPKLAIVGLDTIHAKNTTDAAEQLAAEYRIGSLPAENPHWVHLPRKEQEEWRTTAGSLGYLLARSYAFRAKHEQDSQQFDAALRWNLVGDRWKSDCRILMDQRNRIEQAAGFAANSEAKLVSPAANAPDSALGHLLLGIEQYESADLDAAESSFRSATRAAPQDPAGWLRLADVMVRQGRYREALAYFDVGETLLPKSEHVLFQRGLCHRKNGDAEKAIEDFAKVIALRPDLNAALLNRALAYLDAGHEQLALKDLDKAIATNAANPRAYFIRSRVLATLGRIAESRQDHLQGLGETPQDALGWVARGIANVAANSDQAIDDFEEALRIDPQNTEALNNLAHVHSFYRKDDGRALRFLDVSLEIDNRDTLARAGRGVLLARMGHRDKALNDARLLLQVDDLPPMQRYQVACIYSLLSIDSPQLANKSIQVLIDSLTADFSMLKYLDSDPDLNNIRDLDAFDQAVKAVRALERVKKIESNSDEE